MDNQSDPLWQGGAWEKPSPGFIKPPTVVIPPPQRSVLRVRRRPRWPAIAVLVSMITLFCVITVLISDSLTPRPSFSLPRFPDRDNGYQAQEEEYITDPPTIPKAATGTGVMVELAPARAQGLSFTEIYQKNVPSIVSIESTTQKDYGTGTGIILTQDGYILTNAHVVAGATEVHVIFHDNNLLTASLVGFDADEDLAVLKVDATGLTPAEFGDSALLRCGDTVAAIGDPLGYRSTITDGIVSALDREVEVDGITMLLIQTSAAINFGNSGGALINEFGQVVGITTIKIVTDDGSAEALGFAIPSSRVKYVADTLIDGREVHTGIFGFTVIIRPVPGGGLEVQSVDPDSDAQTKGIQSGDILLRANGQPISSTQDLARIKLALGPGDLVTIVYLRDAQEHTVQVALIAAS